MKTTIYDLSLQGLEIEQLLFDSIGEITPEIQARMDDLLVSGPETMEAAAAVVTQLEASAGMCEMESYRLRERAKQFNDQKEKLKERMKFALDKAFNGKIKTAKWTLYTKRNPDQIIADLVPGITPELLHAERPDLVRVKMELNRVECIRAWKAKELLPELILFEIKTGDRTVIIK